MPSARIVRLVSQSREQSDMTTMTKQRRHTPRDEHRRIPRRPFGRADERVSALALGGYHLGLVGNQREAIKIVHAAIDGGITFMDNAWEYHEGASEEILGKALVGRRDDVFLMTKVCTHGRDRAVAMRQLKQSLRRLKTDHLDLWQVHECVYPNDPDRHFESGGVIEALVEAKEQGLVRYVGFTGHKLPEIHLAMLSHGFPFDSVQMPLNCFDATFRSFEQSVLPEARRQGLAILGMKSMGGEGDAVRKRVVTAEESLRYAMSLPGDDDRERDRLDASASAERAHCAGFVADVRGRDGRAASNELPNSRRTVGTSSTRAPPNTKATLDGKQHGFPTCRTTLRRNN